MRAATVTEHGGAESVQVTNLPDPVAPDDVIVDVRVAGVSYPDLLMVQGRYQRNPTLPYTPGMEIAGTVRSAPPATGLLVGQRVAALTTAGGWAEQVVCEREGVFPIPDHLPFIDAAAMVMNYLTAD